MNKIKVLTEEQWSRYTSCISDFFQYKNYIPSFKNSCIECFNKYFFPHEIHTIEVRNRRIRNEYLCYCIAQEILHGKKVILVLGKRDYTAIRYDISYRVFDYVMSLDKNCYYRFTTLETDYTYMLYQPKFLNNNLFVCKEYIPGLSTKLSPCDVSMYFISTSVLFDVIALKRNFNKLEHRDIPITLMVYKYNRNGVDISDNYFQPIYDKNKIQVCFYSKLVKLLNGMWKRSPDEFKTTEVIQKFLKDNEEFIVYDSVSNSYIFDKTKFIFYYTGL